MGAPDSSIRSAFVTRLQSLTGIPQIAWENTAFTPELGTPYLRPFLLTGEPFQAEIGVDGANRHLGIYQISLYYPALLGVLTLNTMRDSILNHFKRGTVLEYNAFSITIQKAYGGPMMQEQDWVHVPITIQYYLLASN
jgi:hypothetical protein